MLQTHLQMHLRLGAGATFAGMCELIVEGDGGERVATLEMN